MAKVIVRTDEAPKSPVYSQAILQAAGSGLDKAMSATFILGDESDFAAMNEEWSKWFPVDPPARQGAKLPIRRA
jgi:2-iminobutanoate/2-iminopropanoate deaminase